MAELKTDFKNDILDSDMGGRRRYEMVTNSDGTVSFIDKTIYTQVGDNFDANTINGITESISENLANSVQTKYDTESGQPMWKEQGADTWNFFKSSNPSTHSFIGEMIHTSYFPKTESAYSKLDVSSYSTASVSCVYYILNGSESNITMHPIVNGNTMANGSSLTLDLSDTNTIEFCFGRVDTWTTSIPVKFTIELS